MAIVISFLVGLVVSLLNGRSIGSSIIPALTFSLLVGVIFAIFSWAKVAAEQKGYSGILGIGLVLLLKIIGALVLLLLPTREE